MVSVIHDIVIDCADAYALATWWQALLDYVEDPDDPNAPGHEMCEIRSRTQGHLLLFIQVPEGKQVKNRLHFDLRPLDRTRDEEVQRALELGAVQVDDHRQPDGTGWVVLADPEGNEFCIVRSAAERAEARTDAG